MVLEAVMICIDNSDYMRNGDYSPSRLNAQTDTVHLLYSLKEQEHGETCVGVLAMAGKRVEVLTSPCRSERLIRQALSETAPQGHCNFAAALRTARLCLKNRMNKNQRQRVIMFVGSPIEEEGRKLVRVGKEFKKNNVALDVINFGDENSTNENREKLESLVNAVNSQDNSHLLHVPPGPHQLADMVLSSSIMQGAEGAAAPQAAPAAAAAAAAGDGAGANPFGVDPNVDPELYMVLRMSLEEERKRQAGPAQPKTGEATPADTTTTPAAQPAAPADASEAPDAEMKPAAEEENEEEEEEEEDEDFLLQQAIQMSMQQGLEQEKAEPQETVQPAEGAAATEESELLQDKDFMEELLGSVDAGNVNLEDILEGLNEEPENEKKEGEKKPK